MHTHYYWCHVYTAQHTTEVTEVILEYWAIGICIDPLELALQWLPVETQLRELPPPSPLETLPSLVGPSLLSGWGQKGHQWVEPERSCDK